MEKQGKYNKKGKHIIEYTKKHHILSKQTRKQIARITGKLQSYDNKLTGKQRRGLYYNHLKRGNAMKWLSGAFKEESMRYRK